jgi:hypothetical protein
MVKATDDHGNDRLAMLMEAVGNDRLEGEVCPNCFELYSVPILREFQSPILTPGRLDGRDQGMIQNALSELRSAKSQSLLRNAKTGDKLMNEYVCQRCHRRYIGELNLVASQAETKVLSFFGYDASRMYEKDFYSFSVLDSSYSSFVSELWKDSVESPFTTHSMLNDTEDVVTGEVLGQLKRFFSRFLKVVYEDIGATVEIYTEAHAGKQEAGKGFLTPSGADFAIWIGPLTKEDAQTLKAFKDGKITFEKLPVRVGNGAIFQAKKSEGVLDKKQTKDLVKYASINHKGHDYFGIPGKLFMNYLPKAPYVTVLSCDFTYALYQALLGDSKETISFPKALKELSQYATETTLAEFVQAYLSGKAGTPLLLLKDVFGTPGRKLIVGLPPESLGKPAPAGQILAGILDDWGCALGDALVGEIVLLKDAGAVLKPLQIVEEKPTKRVEYKGYSLKQQRSGSASNETPLKAKT